MPVFEWQGISPIGQSVRGEMEAPSRAAVLARLKGERVRPIPSKIREKGKSLRREIAVPGFRDRVRSRDLVIFCRQLAAMIKAGLPMMESLDILADESSNKQLRIALRKTKDDIEAGSTLTKAMEKHPKTFDEFFVSMVAAGELGGVLHSVLLRLASFLEKSMKLKNKIAGAMIYPAAIFCVAVIVTAVLLVFVIPVFTQMFANVGQTLPLPTQFVINLSDFVTVYFRYIVGIAIAAAVGLRQVRHTDRGRLFFDRLSLELPIVGDLMRKSVTAAFAYTLGTLLSAGVPILDALEVTARAAGNKVVERAILVVRRRISEGGTFAEPMKQGKLFPRIVCQMVAVGEATGSLDIMLQNVADLYEDEVDNAVANLMAAVEPAMILFCGVVIGGLLVAMYLPIFKIGSVIG